MKTERCCDDHFQILLHIPSFEGGALPRRRVDDAARNRLVECAGELPIRLKFLKFKQKIFFLYLTFRMDYDILNT